MLIVSAAKAALTMTMMLMAVGTGIIGFTPSYAEIGLAAPLLGAQTCGQGNGLARRSFRL